MPGSQFGQRYMNPNAFLIYQRNQRAGKGDTVLRGDSLLGDEAPNIGSISEDDRKRLEKSLLSEPGLSIGEKRGAYYWDALRRTDTPRKDKK
jgi:hypothetical protein